MFRTTQKLVMVMVLTALLVSTLMAQDGPVSFSLRSVNGYTVTSYSLRGEVVLRDFGASWLPISKTQLEGVRKLADEYSDRGVAVFWVSTESEEPKDDRYAS